MYHLPLVQVHEADKSNAFVRLFLCLCASRKYLDIGGITCAHCIFMWYLFYFTLDLHRRIHSALQHKLACTLQLTAVTVVTSHRCKHMHVWSGGTFIPQARNPY